MLPFTVSLRRIGGGGSGGRECWGPGWSRGGGAGWRVGRGTKEFARSEGRAWGNQDAVEGAPPEQLGAVLLVGGRHDAVVAAVVEDEGPLAWGNQWAQSRELLQATRHARRTP